MIAALLFAAVFIEGADPDTWRGTLQICDTRRVCSVVLSNELFNDVAQCNTAVTEAVRWIIEHDRSERLNVRGACVRQSRENYARDRREFDA